MDFAVAAVGTALQTVIQEWAKFLQKEGRYVTSFGDEYKKMKEMQTRISGFIADVEKLNNEDKLAVNEALSQLREVTYEAQNVLTDCIIRYEYREDASFFCSLFESLHDPFFLHQTGKKLVNINSKMKEKEKTLSMHLKLTDYKGQGSSTTSPGSLTAQNFLPEIIVGLEDDMKTIKTWMFEPTNELKRIAIVGMGGLGKTTIAQKIFHDIEVLDSFDSVVWVAVSQSFSEERISRRILENLKVDTSKMDICDLMSNLQKQLKDKNCLVVLDDVWHQTAEPERKKWWIDLCSFFTKRSCIIITTRDHSVPDNMGVKKSRVHKPDKLNDCLSWCLFSKFAFNSNNGKCKDSQFEQVGKKIVEKCGGLPLAIKIVGSFLEPKVDDLSEWEKVCESFHRSEEIDAVTKSLRLSYNDLSAHLKQCFLRLSVYPEDYEINATNIIHWWVAEGLVQVKEMESSREGDLENSVLKLGIHYLSVLMSRCLLEVADQRRYDGEVISFKIHDMVRDMIIKIAEEAGFCSFDADGRHIWEANSYWLGFTDEMDEKLLRQNSEKLRALILTANRPLEFDKNSGLLLSLRVLDFSGIGKNMDDKCVKNLFDWIGSLRRLACLNLSGVEAVKELPSTIGKLLNLQLLILRGCTELKKIDGSVTRLRRLIILDLASCPLRYFPAGLERLSCLEELKGFKVTIGQTKSKCCTLRELKSLNQLRVLRIVISCTDDATTISEREQDILSALNKLKVLAIDTDERKEEHVLETVNSLGVPPNLQELYLRNYCFESMPNWFDPAKLKSLKYLCVEKADIIHLRNQLVETESCQSGWNIRGLSLKSLSKLQVDWNDLEKATRLDYVDACNCSTKTLKNFPCSVNKPDHWRRGDQKVDEKDKEDQTVDEK